SVSKPVPKRIFLIEPDLFDVLSLKLAGRELPKTLHDIDEVWHDFVPVKPINPGLVDDRVALLYLDVVREGWLIADVAGFAAVIGCLGLFGLSSYTAERRIKEVG